MNQPSGWTLRERHLVPEVMDQPGLERVQHQAALRGLQRINTISRSGAILWPALQQLAIERGSLRVLDLATGGGDVPIWLRQRARAKGVALDVHGCDLSEVAIDYARQRGHEAGVDVEFFVRDVLVDGVPDGYDVVTCSLFLHHLEADDAVRLLRGMAEASRCGILVNDLRRSWMGWIVAYVGTRVLSRSPIVHQDGPQSVRAAFTLEEVRQLAERAGLRDITLSHRWPWRLLLDWRKS